jgi:hypothetical protein
VESEAADEIVLNKVKNKLIKNPKNLPKKGRKGISCFQKWECKPFSVAGFLPQCRVLVT